LRKGWFIIQQVTRREATVELPFFDDSSQAPLAPESVRVEALEVQPYPDLRRLNVQLRLTPFQIPPSIDLVIKNVNLEEVASTSIIGAGSPRLALVMHLHYQQPNGKLTLVASVNYEDLGQVHEMEVEFSLEEAQFPSDEPGEDE
jgi:hypothetical protein